MPKIETMEYAKPGKRGLKGKAIFVLCSILAACLGFAVIFLTTRTASLTRTIVARELEESTGRQAVSISMPLRNAFSKTAVMSASFASLSGTNARITASAILERTLEDDSALSGAWAVFAPNALGDRDSVYRGAPGCSPSGRYVPYWGRIDGKMSFERCADFDSPGTEGDYARIPAETGNPYLSSPAEYCTENRRITVISVCRPILRGSELLGVTGLDIDIEAINGIVTEAKPQGSGFICLFSEDGTIIAHPDPSLGGKSLADCFDAGTADSLLAASDSDNPESVRMPGAKPDYLLAACKLPLGTYSGWGMVSAIPSDKAESAIIGLTALIAMTGMIALGAFVTASIFFSGAPDSLMHAIHSVAVRIDSGDMAADMPGPMVTRGGETGELSRSISRLVGKFRDTVSVMDSSGEKIGRTASDLSACARDLSRNVLAVAEASRELAVLAGQRDPDSLALRELSGRISRSGGSLLDAGERATRMTDEMEKEARLLVAASNGCKNSLDLKPQTAGPLRKRGIFDIPLQGPDFELL